jgi:protein-S-isoprenylcysteine O-methyltransferase Ste14
VTAPDLSFIIPSKAKAWVGLLGSALSFVVPFVLQVTDSLPAPWPAVIGVVLFLLSALGIYKVPNTPPGSVVVADPRPQVAVPVDGSYRNPWRA